MKKKIVGGMLAVLIFSIILQVPNYLRYELEDMFGDPGTYFYDVNIGVMIDSVGGYDEEFDLDEQENISIDLSKYEGQQVKLFLYGRYANSADPLVVVLDEVAYNGQPEREFSNFYSSNYIKKCFLIDITEYTKEGTNRLVLSTGKVTERYDLNLFK